MKITNVTTFVCKGLCMVKVETDEGIYGIGECSPMDEELIGIIVSKRIKPLILGMNPFSMETMEEKVMKGNYKISGQLLAMAYSGVDIALWDLKGKYLNQPVYNLLGGKYRDSVDLYASSMSRDMPVEQECEKVCRAIHEYGVKAVKIKIGSRYGNTFGIPDLKKDERLIRAVREAIGSDCALLLDGNGSYNYSQAVKLYEMVQDCDIFQYEEPCPYFDIEAYVKLSQKLTVAVNLGEQDWSLYTFRDYLSRGVCQIAGADVVKCGGISNAKRVAVLCRAFGAVLSPHNTSRGIGMAASLHLMASCPECNHFQEYIIEKNGVGKSEMLLAKKFEVVDGSMSIPGGPGLGVEIDEERLNSLASVL